MVKVIVNVPENLYEEAQAEEGYISDLKLEIVWEALKEGEIYKESFINKPCVSEKVCLADALKALEKIRLDVIDLEDKVRWEGALAHPELIKGQVWGISKCLDIIDKEIAERDKRMKE